MTGTGGSQLVPQAVPPGSFACAPGVVPGVTSRLLMWQYDSTVLDLLGIAGLDAADAAPPSTLLPGDFAGPLTADAEEGYRVAARAIAAQVMSGAERESFVACDTEDAGCLSDTIPDFGRKAFRRPLSADETSLLEALIPTELEGEGDAVAEEILAEILASPQFFERPITGDGTSDAGGSFPLTSFELATRLSYFVWGSAPDEALLDAAEADLLQTSEQLSAQAERMLDDPRAKRAVRQFHHHYLGIQPWSRWFVGEHDEEAYPAFTPDLTPAAAEELDAFFEAIAFSDGTFSDLWLSNQGFVNAALAPVYGLDASAFGPELVPTPLDADQRPGFLTRVGFLSSFSSYRSTNPILRGLFVSRYVLGLDTGAPPPVDLLPSLPGEFATNRQRTEALTSPSPCRFCHEPYINPPGFALENYDAVGSWQTVDPLGGEIDPVANVFFGSEVRTIETPLELMQVLAASEHARRRYVDQLVSFAFERPPSGEDACVSELLMQVTQAAETPLLDLWTALASTDAFRVGGTVLGD